MSFKNNKLDSNHKDFIFSKMVNENRESMWFGRMVYILNQFPDDFIDNILKKDLSLIYTLYDLEKLIEYAKSENNIMLLSKIKDIPEMNFDNYKGSKRCQAHWLHVLSPLSEILSDVKTEHSFIYDAKYIYKKIQEFDKSYSKFEIWFYDLI